MFISICIPNRYAVLIFLRLNYLFQKEREHKSGGGAERDGGREREIDPPLSIEPNTGLDLTTLRR